MAAARKNILVVDFSVLPVRPEIAKVEKFLCEDMKLQLKDVTTIQLQHIRNCVLIEMASDSLARQYQNVHNCQHVIPYEGRNIKIPVYVDDAAITVRVHDLSTDIPHTAVKKHMEERYGVVLSISRERWKNYFPGIPNGVRVLRMHLTKPIPSFIEIEGQLTSITYPNQEKSCRFCQGKAHPQQRCPDKVQQKASEPQSTLFNLNDFPALTGPTPSSTNVAKSAVQTVSAQAAAPLQTETIEAVAVVTQEHADVESTNDEDNDGTDDTDSSTVETETNKRRLSRTNTNEPKKKCVPVGSKQAEKLCAIAATLV